jgi:hypothetical protein
MVSENGTIGREGGYAASDPLAVTTADGLNASEREAVLARTMARVEEIRRLEFTENVTVRVITREQYRRNASRGSGSPAYEGWNNQVWEALFVVDEATNVSAAMGDTFGTAVLAFYSGEGRITMVTDSPTPVIDTRTLAHELVHALQDQRLTLARGQRTQDAQLARSGLIEGDANYVEDRYLQRCGAVWSCLPRPERNRSATGQFNEGILLTVLTPYVEGPALVDHLFSTGDWAAVNDAYRAIPASTEQVIHPELYPDERPVEVRVPDRSAPSWRRFDVDPQADTVGEASIYAMFYTNGVVEGSHAQYDYDHPLSAGWGGDSVVPYTNGSAAGYVWRTVWDTEADAREFAEGYRDLLRAHDATRQGEGVWVVPESDPFADAFRVTVVGDTVTVVNAPTVAALDDVHAGE